MLIDYVLKINDNKLTRNFIITIANQWKRSNIKTVEEAMNLCRKENQAKKKPRVKPAIKKEEKPDWFDKNIEEDAASSDDIAALEATLKGL